MLYILFFIILNPVRALEREGQCTPPSQYLVMEKLRRSFNIEAGEKELRDIVKDPRNHEAREKVKSLKRRLLFAKRRDIPPLLSGLQENFNQMLSTVETEPLIPNFPYKGASSAVTSTEDGHLQIIMDGLVINDMDFIPPETQSKVGKRITIKYKYPYDSYEYFLTFQGEELPVGQALFKVLDEFEDSCRVRIKENIRDRAFEERGAGTVARQ